jgi:hypothetical protein
VLYNADVLCLGEQSTVAPRCRIDPGPFKLLSAAVFLSVLRPTHTGVVVMELS